MAESGAHGPSVRARLRLAVFEQQQTATGGNLMAKHRWIGLALVLALAATACGDDDDDSGSSGASDTTAAAASETSAGGSGTTTAATGSPIVVGGVSSVKNFDGTDIGFKARIARLNASGGIDGHPIEFVGVRDDNADPATNLTAVQELVLKDKISVLAPVNSVAFLNDAAKVATDNQVPYIGWGFLPAFCANPWGWGFNGCLEPEGDITTTSTAEPIINVLGGAANVKYADAENNNSAGINGAKVLKAVFEALGAEVVLVDTSLPVSGVTDYTPLVSSIMSSGANVVGLGLALPQSIALRAALYAAGYEGVTQDFQAYVPGLLEKDPALAAALQGNYVNVQIPPQESGSPATNQEAEDLEAIGESPVATLGVSLGYWQADLLIQMLQATSKAGLPLTGAGLQEAVNKGFTYTPELEGGLGTITFPEAQDVPVPCAGLVQIEGTEYKVVEPFKCYTTGTLAEITAKLGKK